MVLRITHYGEPILRQPGKRVEVFDEALRALARDMVETMHAAEGIGLAAQQVGHALQLAVIDVVDLEPEDRDYTLDAKQPPLDLIMPLVLVNPEVQVLPGPAEVAEEGCLSFPDIRGDVPRVERVRVRFQDLQGQVHHLETSGWMARVILHEYDHLQGVLFIDHMDTRTRRRLEPHVKRLKADTERALSENPPQSS